MQSKNELAVFLALIIFGATGIALAILVTPDFATAYFSHDKSISPSGLEKLQTFRLLSCINGSILSITGSISLLFAQPQRRIGISDICVVSFLMIFISFFTVQFVNFSAVPTEDAAILMRYAQHFGLGSGVVWNIGDKPVDGATDFLFMVIVGLMVKVGFSLELSVKMIGLTSHMLSVIIIYAALRDLYRANILPALISALYLASGPGLFYVAAYFGTPFFALFACITWWTALKLMMQKNNSHTLSLLFAISGLITGLIRPDGVILAGLMMLSIMYYRGIKQSRMSALYFIGIFAFIGGIYFFWRWQYFGYPLPNPFYKKGGGKLHLSGLENSISNTFNLCLPFLTAFILGIRSPKTLRLTISCLIPVLGFAAAYVLLSEEMNFLGRFQYALLPVVLMGWYPLVKDIGSDFHFQNWNEMDWQKRVMLVFFISALSLGAIAYQYSFSSRPTYSKDGRNDVARMLGKYRDKGYTIATTEAGLLPLYSGWRAVDTYGLNDQWIAHNGGITTEYLDRYKPQVITFYANFSNIVPAHNIGNPPPDKGGTWFEMVRILKDYAEKNGYVLAAILGDTPYESHYYYVRKDFIESTEIVKELRSMKYYWFKTGRIAVNYALLEK